MKYLSCLAIFATFLFIVVPASAAPYFYFDGTASAVQNVNKTIEVYLYTDSQTLTAAETVISFDNNYLQASSISIIGSRCNFWTPADPASSYYISGRATPHYYPYPDASNPNFTSNTHVAISCGFANPGYQSSGANGNIVARIILKPITLGSTSLSFLSPNTQFRYIGSSIAAGAMANFDLTVYESTSSGSSSGSTTTPTPSPTSSGSATPTASTSSGNSDTLTEDELNFVEIGTNNNSVSTVGDDISLEVVDEDDTVPAPPANLAQRAAATPFIFSLLSGGGGAGGGAGGAGGEVLAAQSLRELLIPGKSSADKTVVMINLISTLTFLALLAIVIWRLITITRMNRLKTKHMKDFLSSELAAIESKIGALDNPDSKNALKQNLNETMKKLSGELDEDNSQKS